MLLAKCVYCGDEKVGGVVNKTSASENILIAHSDKAKLLFMWTNTLKSENIREIY